MKIVDSQVHVWDSVLNDSFKPHRSTPFGIGELLIEMENAGVDKVVRYHLPGLQKERPR